MNNAIRITQKKLKINFLIVLLIAYCILLTAAPKAHAQEQQRAITIVPPSISLTLNPGDKSEGVLKVINDSDAPLTFTASTQDFIVEDTQGTPDFLPKDTLGKPYSAASWIGIVPDNFTVAPHQKAILNYYIQVPKNARPGGHYAGVLYTPSSTLGTGATGPAVQTQMGTLFSLDVAGPIHEQASVSKFMAEHGFYEYGPVSILTQIQNFGDLHIKPLGTITIYDMLGRKLGTLPLAEHNIFPMAARDFVNVFGQHWMVGPFTAKFVASYGRNGNLPLTATMVFWVFPWKVAVVIILLIVAAVMGYLYWKKRNGMKGPLSPSHEATHASVASREHPTSEKASEEKKES